LQARQEQLEADVRRSWEKDSIALPSGKGRLEVHGKAEAVN